MKPAFTFTLATLALLALAPLAHADYWATLAGAHDSITLKKGETALIMTVDEACVIQYTQHNRRPVQIEVGGSVYKSTNWDHPYHQSFLHLARNKFPMALTGPANIAVKTSNVVSLQIVQTQIQKPVAAAAAEPPAKAALWQSLASR